MTTCATETLSRTLSAPPTAIFVKVGDASGQMVDAFPGKALSQLLSARLFVTRVNQNARAGFRRHQRRVGPFTHLS